MSTQPEYRCRKGQIAYSMKTVPPTGNMKSDLPAVQITTHLYDADGKYQQQIGSVDVPIEAACEIQSQLELAQGFQREEGSVNLWDWEALLTQ